MLYYIFKVRTNKPDIIPDYYILNNRYIGYVGFDSGGPQNSLRPKLEYHAKIKNTYQLFAMGEVKNDEKLHKIFFESERMNFEKISKLIKKYDFIEHEDDTWYKEYYPNKNSSQSILKAVDYTKVILDDGLILTYGEFKNNKSKYMR